MIATCPLDGKNLEFCDSVELVIRKYDPLRKGVARRTTPVSSPGFGLLAIFDGLTYANVYVTVARSVSYCTAKTNTDELKS
jgi:hypothetical protein